MHEDYRLLWHRAAVDGVGEGPAIFELHALILLLHRMRWDSCLVARVAELVVATSTGDGGARKATLPSPPGVSATGSAW